MAQTKPQLSGNIITEEVTGWLANGLVRFRNLDGHGHRSLMLFAEMADAQHFSTLEPPRRATVTIRYKFRASDTRRTDIEIDEAAAAAAAAAAPPAPATRPHGTRKRNSSVEAQAARTERNADILRRYRDGETMRSIARVHGITDVRVSQIIAAAKRSRQA